MKKIILMAAALPFAFMSCKNSGTETARQEARTQQMTIDSLKTEIVKQQIIDSMNRVATIPVNNSLQSDSRVVAMPVASPVASAPVKSTHKPTKHRSTAKRTHHSNYSSYNDNAYAGNYGNNNYSNGSGNYDNGTYAQPVQQQTRKGWNNKVKGSVIGAGAGAIAGALIDHRKGRGALLGGLLGGGAGLGVGALLDRRQGN